VRLVKIPVLLRAMQRSEARDGLAVAALAQTQSERQRSASVSNRSVQISKARSYTEIEEFWDEHDLIDY
jgi:tryptophan 2,3-dioxygenase